MLLKQAKLHHSLSNKLLFNHIILRKKNFNCNCGRNKSFPNQVLFALGMGRGVDATLTNLFNPTLGRDASHPCLISTWPKEGCIIVCCDLGIMNRYSTSAYPQGNGQAETVNKVIVGGLKKRLDDTKGKWVEELPHVLWTYQTIPRRSRRETPFLMTYGTEAIIPLEIGFPTLRMSFFTPGNNDGLLGKSLDLIEERRENAMVQLAYYQHKLKQGYDVSVKLRPLAPRDLVLRKVLGTAKNPAWGKLGPNWEGSYRITSVAGIGTYHLKDLDENVVPCPWNVNNLRMYYYWWKFSLPYFFFVTLYVMRSIIWLNIKQNFGHAWLLGPHTLGKLIY